MLGKPHRSPSVNYLESPLYKAIMDCRQRSHVVSDSLRQTIGHEDPYPTPVGETAMDRSAKLMYDQIEETKRNAILCFPSDCRYLEVINVRIWFYVPGTRGQHVETVTVHIHIGDNFQLPAIRSVLVRFPTAHSFKVWRVR